MELEIISPERKVSHTDVALLLANTSGGQLGIMKQHENLIARLKPGLLCVRLQAVGSAAKYFTTGGFIKAHGNYCEVICEQFYSWEQLKNLSWDGHPQADMISSILSGNGSENIC